MKRHLFSALALASVAAPPLAPAHAAEIQLQAEAPVVELQVTEVVTSPPDAATVSAGVMTRAMTARDAIRQNAEQMERLIARMRALGIERKDIQTSNFNLSPNYSYNQQTGEQTFNGYNVNNQLSVTLRKLDRAGEALDALVAAGANNIYGPNFMLEDNKAATEEARSKAFAKGMEQARAYARMAGYSDVRLLEVNENIMRNYGGGGGAIVATAARAESAADTPIEPGEVGTAVSIGLKYEMTR